MCLDFGFSGVCHHAVPLDSASHDPRGGAKPCRRLVGVRDEQFALFSGAHHPPRDYMDCRPGANVELGLLLAMVRHGSRRQSQLDSASEPLERKCVVDVYWSPEHNSNSRSYTVQAGQTLHGALVYIQRRGRFVHNQPDGCGDRRDELSGRSVPDWKEVRRRTLSTRGRSLATRTLEMARSASETLLSSATARTSRFSSIHHAWDHATVFLFCASSRGRHSKCRGGSCSSAVVFLVLSNRERSNCSCQG